MHQLTQLRSEMQASARNAMREDMRTKLVNRDEIAKFLTPEFPVGCRRLTPGPGFLEAFQRDNVSGNARQGWDCSGPIARQQVQMVRKGVKKAVDFGLVDDDGQTRVYDVIST